MLTEQLLSEIESGQGLRLAQAAKLLPSNRGNKPVTMSCLCRWVLSGVKLPSGAVIRLEAARLSGKWLTSAAAIRRFVAAQTPNINADPAPTTRTARQQQRA